MWKKLLNIINHQENTNLNHKEILPHIHKDGHYQNKKENKAKAKTKLARKWRTLEPTYTVVWNIKWYVIYGN